MEPEAAGKLSIRAEIERGSAALRAASATPQRDAALLLGRVLGRDRGWLLAHPDETLTDAERSAYASMLLRRAQHEPIQYIVGEQEFWGLRLRVSPAVLIPRPESEHLVEAVLARLPGDRPLRIADVGTGSGAIALALAHALPQARVEALDISRDALDVAQANAAAHGLESRVRFRCSDLLSAVAAQRFDCIVSNPPYIAAGEMLEPQVAAWEPHLALFAGPGGVELYARLLPEAARLLEPGGLLALEIGHGQQTAVGQLLAPDENGAQQHPQQPQQPWTSPEFLPDLRGIPRVALAWRR